MSNILIYQYGDQYVLFESLNVTLDAGAKFYQNHNLVFFGGNVLQILSYYKNKSKIPKIFPKSSKNVT